MVARLDRSDGDIDAISKRVAISAPGPNIAQRTNRVADESHWRGETRAVEDRLSDTLHARLTQRFVDRRTSVLLRRLKQKESLVAEVNDKSDVTVAGELVGRLEGFRFRQDATNSPDEARVLRQAAVQALRPQFHLLADKFYNAPDTEMDFTEQGGLMWGGSAVGKLVTGPDAMRPQVEAFVDEDAGEEVVEKVRRRLQHFIDRKVAALFEPLLALSRDEALTGLARGFAFRLVEGLGLLTRGSVAEDVKALEQDARSALRKHGVRFGQFTIFLPLLLKPAPTRLRLVLWSLASGLAEFPESPPPGLVTIPNLPEVPKGHYTLAGYHPAGARAIRIDMLERLADLVRAKDSRAGFEATPEMLSITGMTLEQFADLMAGLGYKAERSGRAKTRPEAVAVAAADAPEAPEAGGEAVVEAAPEAGVEALAEAAPEVVAEIDSGVVAAAAEPAAESGAKPGAEPAAEMETVFTFTWAPRPRGGENRGPRNRTEARAPREGQPAGDARPPRSARRRPSGAPSPDAPVAAITGAEAAPEAAPRPPRSDRPEHFKGIGKGKGGKPEGKGERGGSERGRDFGGERGGKDHAPHGAKVFEARPPRVEKPIDPDNPFAALLALKGRI
ncbi:MAG: hypothetical protein Q8Q26_14280 [Pseudorhodobacter sp.]|nr:hypothetical protein [Pseudorhodobacter sp.]